MNRSVKISQPRVTRIVDTSPKPSRVSGEEFAAALGATPTGHEMLTNLPPDVNVALFEKVAQEIVSTGGRPGRKGETERKKIPLTKAEWQELQAMADQCRKKGLSVSPAQLGGLLVREGLRAYQATTNSQGVHEGVGELLAAASSDDTISQLRPVAEPLVHEMKARKAHGKVKR